MTMIDEQKSNGRTEPVTRAWEARFARIEERVAKSEESHEQRVLILRDAMADFVRDFIVNKLAPLDAEIVALKKQNVELKRQLQEKSNVDQQVAEIARRLDAQAAARDEAKRGKMGPQGQRGARGRAWASGAAWTGGEARQARSIVP